MIKETILSSCRTYRYVLYRHNSLSASNKIMIFVMINPSTADENQNDHTIRKCLKIAHHHDCEHVYVVNLIPYRSKNVEDVDNFVSKLSIEALHTINNVNWNYIDEILQSNDKKPIIICGWGKYDKVRTTLSQATEFYDKYKSFKLKCLKINKDQSPIHPLFVNSQSILLDFNPTNLIKIEV